MNASARLLALFFVAAAASFAPNCDGFVSGSPTASASEPIPVEDDRCEAEVDVQVSVLDVGRALVR
ncbi:MAG: hypothetical protein AAFZ18_36385 [Myxococcota bacterium]